jgi:hypothetical protein
MVVGPVDAGARHSLSKVAFNYRLGGLDAGVRWNDKQVGLSRWSVNTSVIPPVWIYRIGALC